jgi:hypothetical protein
VEDSTARGQDPEASLKRKPSEVPVDEYLWAAEKAGSLKGMARFLQMPYSSMHDHLKRSGLFDHVYNLLNEQPGKPGPKKPPMPLVEGATSEVEVDVEVIKEAARKRYELKARRAQQKDNQHIRFDYGPVAIFIVSDQHFGNQGTDVGRVFDEQRIIMKTPASYVWQAGDVVDSFIVGKLIAENFKPSLPIFEQWALARAYLKEFKDKLLAHVAGNHDHWHYRLTGIDYAREITPSTVLYDSDEIRATIHVGDKQFRINSRHKVRGNSMYNITHGLERLARFDSPDFDIYAAAHVHRGAVAREFTLNEQRKLAVMSGSYKTIDSYARQVGFERHDASTAVGIVLEDDGTFWATANIKAVMKYQRAVYPRES